MAFLFVGGQAVDWVSFWTWDHTPHEAVLRDIDDDGGLDLGFRLEPEVPGAYGLRQYAWPTRTEKWLRAYRITNEGFDSIFPDADRQMPVRVHLESKDPRVRLATDIPSTVREYDLLEYSLEVVNTSTDAVAVRDMGAIRLQWSGAAGFGIGPGLKREIIKPGEKVLLRALLLLVQGPYEGEVVLSWTFVPRAHPAALP